MNEAATTEPLAEARPKTLRQGPWSAAEVVVLFFLVYSFWPSLVFQVLEQTHFFAWYYSPGEADLPIRQQLWARALALPFQVATIPAVLILLHGALPPALGLTRRLLGRNVLLGLVSAAILIVTILPLHEMFVQFYRRLFNISISEHPLARLGQQHLTGIEWALWWLAATVAAPLVEELLFRGLFQGWVRAYRWGGAIAMLIALVVAGAGRSSEFTAALTRFREAGFEVARSALFDAIAPLVITLALIPVFLLVAWSSRTNEDSAVFGTAVLFAMVHVTVWPSPVALLFLGLALGWLKERTRSLAAPIVVHGLFNGVSCACSCSVGREIGYCPSRSLAPIGKGGRG